MVVIALIALFILVIRPFLFWWTTQYVFTNRRIIIRTGIIARKGRVCSAVEGERRLVQPFGLGSGCSTPAHSMVEIFAENGQLVIENIPKVEQVQQRSTACTTRDDAFRRARSSGLRLERRPTNRDRDDAQGGRCGASRAQKRNAGADPGDVAGRPASSTRGEVARVTPGSRWSPVRSAVAFHGCADVGDESVAFTDEDVNTLHHCHDLIQIGTAGLHRPPTCSSAGDPRHAPLGRLADQQPRRPAGAQWHDRARRRAGSQHPGGLRRRGRVAHAGPRRCWSDVGQSPPR